MTHGQAVVEFALTLPLLLLVLFGVLATGYLGIVRPQMQNGVDVLAQLAAREETWRDHVPSENARVRCNAEPLEPAVSYPDGAGSGHRIRLTWHCHDPFAAYLWSLVGVKSGGIDVSSEAVIQ